jgi:hypothetical protein
LGYGWDVKKIHWPNWWAVEPPIQKSENHVGPSFQVGGNVKKKGNKNKNKKTKTNTPQ